MTAIRGAAAITGAASGIGRALAIELASRGCDLALADRDEAGLKALAAEIGAQRKISVHRVDVGEPDDIAQFAREAIAAHPALNIVINNAGVALMGTFEEIDQAQMDWLFDINFWGVVHGTRAFLPHLKARPEAHIVNISSIFGIIAPPGQSAYAAAKFAVRGFSESVRHELAVAGSPVRLSVVHPGGVATSIARSSRTGVGVTDNARRAQMIDRFESAARTTPKDAALRIIRGIEKNEPRILIGNDARFMDILQRFRPGTYWAPLQRRLEKMAKGAAKSSGPQ
ncbi:SDR family oxidoreductase [Bradyrhizobium sp. WYCCWR 13023]|uniref:SDR family oxidoreductase n=1 Tax=Bradyrhizobium zhengyangense TaxID=2911009 RepID=A0A9X1RJG3_9BRAD|nr:MULTISPECIES: SDR family oxidoreductase [Bradyrhizobium]MCG2631315.1 SDR family oxidoreductase [Bradyrhizobium zhengyangense]MCG2644187.1 SDR family oxidoreductase [Bradyrhizobium zhengyangense]MCG2669870.1 SDR family oxidoreductase [Bradyrhizobium zhengyangense]MDA9525255.1 acetoin dehydrogenase [Bradyrhizobium sp. CCBAU 11434]